MLSALSHSFSHHVKTYSLSAVGTGMKAVTTCGSHDVIVDQAVQSGGTDLGANPLETVFAGLLGCEQATAMYIAMQEKLDIQGIDWSLTSDIDVGGFLGLPDASPQAYKTLNVEGVVSGNVTDEQLEHLCHAVHDRCPVASLFGHAEDIDFTMTMRRK
ncbi:OsmC/Ohr family protein [Kipferlia bialata]|uniref:OsmC/Ohr family protein n=1 Tax=Kipferlia bialata TaxID=797122 RepID=A0A9K3GN42_9EUKA|nr:OsmC/Ohr family protein [Kipferlia bialata]|eukprot:g11416.t1